MPGDLSEAENAREKVRHPEPPPQHLLITYKHFFIEKVEALVILVP